MVRTVRKLLLEILSKLESHLEKGLFRSIGDAGDAPSDVAGYTVLSRLHRIESWLYQILGAVTLPANAETYTTTPLAAGATYFGSAQDFLASRLGFMGCVAYADQPSATNGFCIEQSIDGTNWDLTGIAATTVSAGVGAGIKGAVVTRYTRVKYVNGATAQTVFRLGGRYAIA